MNTNSKLCSKLDLPSMRAGEVMTVTEPLMVSARARFT